MASAMVVSWLMALPVRLIRHLETCSTGDFLSLPSNRDYLVKVEIPTEADVYGAAAVHPNAALYKVTREEDINIANGDSFVPQVPPPPCAGPLHTVDVAGSGYRQLSSSCRSWLR